MKKVLLLGDSIRMSYQDSVKKMLEGQAEVTGPADNGRFAKYSLCSIREWLNINPDIVHWNNGIWDISHYQSDKIFTNKNEYIRDLELILSIIKKKNIAVIWATTTLVSDICRDCHNEDIDEFNKAAAVLMEKHNIYVNDLNSAMKNCDENLFIEDGLHLNQKGIDFCTVKVVDAIKQYL